MQQRGGGGFQYSASQPEMTAFATAAAAATDPRTHILQGGGVNTGHHNHHHQQQIQQLFGQLGDQSMGVEAEAASPISSRPPAVGNFEELLRVTTGSNGGEEDPLGGDEADRGGVANRWPRQETLALLKIRSEMDAAFRDTTLKGPLWEDISRKLAEVGYKRSGKKCKEKFENVQKYYKRTKETRAGRQDAKSYKFFTQLEAFHTNVSTPTPAAIPVSPALPQAQPPPSAVSLYPPVSCVGTPPAIVVAAPPATNIGVSFSSDTSSFSDSDEVEDEDQEEKEMKVEHELKGEPENTRKRKRVSSSSKSGSSSSQWMMEEFFEGLIKQVMQKQEAMQQRFLEAIEKREQDRIIREEAWKRQEMTRLAREHDLIAQERTVSASKDAAIIAFLQKITGQTIQLPPTSTIPATLLPPPPPPPPPPTVPVTQPLSSPSLPPPHAPVTEPLSSPPPLPVPVTQPLPPLPPPPQLSSQDHHQEPQEMQQQKHHYQQQQLLHHHQNPQTTEVSQNQPPISSTIVAVIPEQQVQTQEIGEGGSFEATSSRWPKAEVLALIKLRSGLESRYQEAAPKGPLWEEISAGMQRMGYKRSIKKCKEKWENINKYFKKVKESNKKRPEDAKTCPYFHELDALYQRKTLASLNRPEQHHKSLQESMTMDPKRQERSDAPLVLASPQTAQNRELENKDGGGTDLQTINGGFTASLFGEGSHGGGGLKKPEDIVRKQEQNHPQELMINYYDKIEEADNDDVDEEEDNDELDYDDTEEDEEEMKMAYKIQFQRHNTSSSNVGAKGAPSFFTIFQ